ncbi:MAG TPA: D-alanyl-D-alanine carboxypeptidase/D-alanyl-D-alanine-endopeptidase [Ignavibacteriaceae bacterium]|nr:D-alanyl-D-alanine carboxypeptidase/D-alanyl-D-alanine-endopeptidase [Ignavibacteriaceae bacterium]
MKKFIFFFFVIISSNTFPQLYEKLVEYNNSPELKNSQFSVYAEYCSSGKEIFSYNSQFALAPASNLKIFSSAVALCLLGSDFKYETNLYYSGNIEDGVLNGNIYIQGGGDPTLGSNRVKTSTPLDSLLILWSSEIKKLGITKIYGSIIADASMYEKFTVPNYYPWIDIGNYYGAGTSALNIFDNLYYLYFKPGKQINDSASVLRTYPFIKNLKFENDMKTGEEGSGDNGYIYNAPYSNNAYLFGTIPSGVNEFSIRGSIPNPPLTTCYLLQDELIKNSITISSSPYVVNDKIDYTNSKLIYKHYSPELKDIVYMINKISFNLYAEQVFKTAGLKMFGEGTTYNGVKAVKRFLDSVGVPTDGLDLYDGSGLSRTNTITTKMMCKLLSFMTTQPTYDAFYNSLGIAGDPNDISSFKNFGANTLIAKNARIKSGTINGVKSHSGYVKNKKGDLISFSIITNNYDGSSSKLTNIHSKIVQMIADDY